MSLHGTIEVNGDQIGNWIATREPTQYAPTPNTLLIYSCYVHILTDQKHTPSLTWRGTVQHRFGDGALALAATVLEAAHRNTNIGQ